MADWVEGALLSITKPDSTVLAIQGVAGGATASKGIDIVSAE